MIDYNQDIAPLRQNYFPTLVGERGFDQSMDYHNKVLMPMRMQTMKLEQHAMSMKRQDLAFETQKLGDLTTYKFKGRTYILLKPSTYMNLSGKAVQYWLTKEKIPKEHHMNTQ